MGTKTIAVNGDTFKVGKNVRVNSVANHKGAKLQWRMHKTLGHTVQLREAFKGTVVIAYDVIEPVPEAAYYPFIVNKSQRS